MSRFGGRGPILTKKTSDEGGRSRGNVDVDPVLAAILGLVIIGGGGLAAYGASQDTEPAPAPAPAVQADDPVVARALAIVREVDGTAAVGEGDTAAEQRREARRARDASERGRTTDPFAAIKSATEAVNQVAGGSSTASNATSSAATAVEQARQARATADAAAAAAAGSATTKPSTGTGSATGARAAARRAAASQPAKVTLRIADRTGRSTRSKRSLGYPVPSATRFVAKVAAVSRNNEVVTLRLRSGAALTGEQSPGTRCTQRVAGECRLVRVRTGKTAVIRGPETPSGRRGPVTAVRILTIWRGGFKMAD